MRKYKMLFITWLIVSLFLAACSARSSTPDSGTEPTAAVMEAEPTADMMDDTAAPDEIMEEPVDEAGTMMTESPGWFSAPLTDVSTGESFTINDYKGKVVLVETMAVWCTTCKRQQGEVKTLHENLGMPDNLVTVVLDVDPNEDAVMLKNYAASNGFDWVYAIAPPDVAREVANLYGAQFLNPPSAPMLIIDAKGQAHPLPFGVKSAADLEQQLKPFLEAAMN